MKLLYISFILILIASCTAKNKQVEIKVLPNYPSASAIEYFNDHFYIIGDDAKSILILDKDLIIKDSIQLYDAKEYRIPKPTKPDLESLTVLYTANGYRLLTLGSGSLKPYRNVGWMIDPETKQANNFRLDSLYDRLTSSLGIREINIEGVCALQAGILLVSRGHLAYPENNLLFIDSSWYFNLDNAVARKIKLEKAAIDTSSIFNGVSGLSYSTKTDRLFLTLSTELTTSTFGDGTIGKSYLWIINNFSKKLDLEKVAPDKIIALEKIDPGFKNQKIESVCIISERKNEMQLAMVADNDDGSSTVFKLRIDVD